MPLVEVVPNSSTSSATPGWSYVVDTGYDPSKAPLVPSGARDRARNSTFAGSGARESYSARQQAIIAKHIADLDKENPRDVQIVVPNKPGNVAQRSISGHMSAGVRKILQSNKTWANYLADEEAAAAQLQQQPARAVAVPHHETPKQIQAPLKRKSSVMEVQTPQVEVPVKRGPGRPPKPKPKPQPVEIDPPPAPLDVATVEEEKTTSTIDVDLNKDIDEDPFLRPRIPKLPTDAEIEALLSAPPLSYAAARAGPTTSTAPPRQFCEMCGYWGRARCMKCGARVCGLDCKTQHEETRCQKFYA